MKNIIHRLTLDLSFQSSETELPAINRIIDTEYRDKIIQIIKDEIEKIASEQIIIIEKIEINVEETKSIEELIKQIKTQLKQQFSYHLKIQNAKNQLLIIGDNESKQISTERVWNFDSLCYFLETGSYYWQEQQVLFQENPKEVFYEVQKHLNRKPLELLHFFIKKPNAFIRFLIYFKEISIEFLESETPKFTHFREDIKSLLHRLVNLETHQLTSADSRLWISLLEVLILPSKNQNQSFKVICILLEIIIKKGIIIFDLIEAFQGKILKLEANGIDIAILPNTIIYNKQQERKLQLYEIYQHKIRKVLGYLSQKNIALDQSLQSYIMSNVNLQILENDLFQQIKNNPVQNNPRNERQLNLNFSIKNAGLVLLHPFFEFLFLEFNLVKNGVFLNKKGQHKAIQLLHYLATNNSKFSESEVILNKILCGIAPNEPVVMRKGLSVKAKKSCKELLTQTILYWDVLKNTSPKSLQKEFIQRTGTIFIENDQTIINIEKKTIDILLERLPWGLGMIKLPWVDKIIFAYYTENT